MLVHACNPSTWKVRAGGSRIQGHPEVHCKFEASLGHMKPSPKNQNKTKNQNQNQTKNKTKKTHPTQTNKKSHPLENYCQQFMPRNKASITIYL